MFARHDSLDKIVISVQDTGIGMSQVEQRNLFQMFGCLKSSQNLNSNGIGLGLFICKLIVQEFDGDIIVDSQPGVGSKFTFSFLLKNEGRSEQKRETEHSLIE